MFVEVSAYDYIFSFTVTFSFYSGLNIYLEMKFSGNFDRQNSTRVFTLKYLENGELNRESFTNSVIVRSF